VGPLAKAAGGLLASLERDLARVAGGGKRQATSPTGMIGRAVDAGRGTQGVVRFLGRVDFAHGEWAGLELDRPVGKNDGSVQGQRYFDAAPNCGLFVRASALSLR